MLLPIIRRLLSRSLNFPFCCDDVQFDLGDIVSLSYGGTIHIYEMQVCTYS